MNRRTRLIFWFTVPVFGLVFVVVRAMWLTYLGSLSLGEIHMRIFDHSTAVAIGMWGVCIALTAIIVWALTGRLIRSSVSDDPRAV